MKMKKVVGCEKKMLRKCNFLNNYEINSKLLFFDKIFIYIIYFIFLF